MPKSAKTITVEDSVWESVIKHCKQENRGISNFVETVLKRYFDQKENPE